jgi:hypothetical protein
MSGFRTRLTNLFRRLRRRHVDSEAADSKEVERLNAEYTGSFARNPGQELGLLPPRYDDKTFGH